MNLFNYYRIFLFSSLLIGHLNLNAQTGPGGVGTATDNIFWLKADEITGLINNDPVSTWSDKSGNAKDLTQGIAAYRPLYVTNQINNKPAVRFDGDNDYLIRNPFAAFATNRITAIIVNRNNGEFDDGILSYASSASDNNFLLYNSSDMNIYRGGSFVNTSTAMNDNSFHIGTTRWNTTGGDTRYNKDGTQTYTGSMASGTSITSGGSLVLAQDQDNTGGGFDISQAHSGDYAEVILYNTFLNEAQTIIVQNYVAAKYLISLSANDYFAYELSHGNDVAGIGQVNASNTHTDAMSANIFEISNPSGLGDNEYFLFGHDNASIASWSTSELPGGDITDARRIVREWRCSETGDVGNVTITLDASLLPAALGGFTQYVVWVDADGDFSSGATYYPLTSIGSNKYQVTGKKIANGDFVTFGVVCPKIQFTSASSSGFENVTPATVEVSLNYPVAATTTVSYTVSGGTATGGGIDYTLANGTVTIAAGNTTQNISIVLNNDIVVESDETIIITLSDPSAGINLGTNTTHTFTIHDDDNARKIGFAVASSSGSEAVTSISLTLEINTVDGTNPTTVQYSATGGTATGGGDYTLATGTATIPSNTYTTTITFSVNNDALNEDNETIIITLTNPTNSNLSATYIYTYTITDNDPIPSVQFSTTSSSGSENTTPVSIQVALSAVAGRNTSIDYATTGGTATGSGVDYTLVSGTLNITAGSINASFSLSITNDAMEESPETVIITLSNPYNASLGVNSTYTYTIQDDNPFGHTGPGGVGKTDNNILWLSSDQISGLSNGNNVTSWADISGNNNTVTQSNTTFRPRYYTNVVNSKPVVRFEQSNSRIRNTAFSNGPTDAITALFVNKTSDNNDGILSYATTSNSNAFLIFGSENVELDNSAGSQTSSMAINDNTWRITGVTWQSIGTWKLYRNGTQSFSGNLDPAIIGTTGCFAIGGDQDALDGSYDPAQAHQGDFSEIILYRTVLNSAKRIIVENYLSSKYNIAIANDRFAYDATYGNDVAGIGRVDINNIHLDAKGPGMVRMNNASSMDDGDYLLWGHNNASLIPNITDVPSGIDNRLNRVWRLTKTNDVGTVDISFDLTGFTVSSGNDLELLIDNDGVFNNATRYTTGRTWNPPVVTFTGVNFADGNYFTVGSTDPATPLPITLLYLKAISKTNNTVTVKWATATEINLNYFTIEGSSDAINWKAISTVKGAGNKNSITNYQFTDSISGLDTNPQNNVYYRLSSTDFDGKTAVYKVISASCFNSDSNGILLFPNPNSGNFTISGVTEESNLTIINSIGEIVFIQKVNSNFASIDASSLPNGIYYLLVKSNHSYISKPIVINK